jgi:membrane-bound lytic murein transglycosylase B
VIPDGPEGRAFLVYDNFRATLRWNRSNYFALAVGLLSDRIGAN